MFPMFGLRRPDVSELGDPGLENEMEEICKAPDIRSNDAMHECAASWSA